MIVTGISMGLGFYLIGVWVISRHWSDLGWRQRLISPFTILLNITLFALVSPCLFGAKLSEDLAKDISRRHLQKALKRGKRYGASKN